MSRENTSDLEEIEQFERLEKLYRTYSQESPSPDVDKQIIAFAHRDVSQPDNYRLRKLCPWRRLLFPVYLAAAFSFVAITAHWLWPQIGMDSPPKTLPGTAPPSVSFEMLPHKTNKIEATAKSSNDGAHKSDVAAQFSEQVNSTKSGLSSNQIMESSSEPMQKREVQAAHQRKNLQRDEWVVVISTLIDNKKYRAAEDQLIHFKQVYPDYPVDDMFERLPR